MNIFKFIAVVLTFSGVNNGAYASTQIEQNEIKTRQGQYAKPVTLHLVGDSTMSNKPMLSYPERGWGQLLPEFMLPTINIRNHAANGRSTKRFVDEGRWKVLLSEVSKGDYVVIQFGHNDQKVEDPARYADAENAYPTYLTRFVGDVEKKGANVLIASSICRRHFDEAGNLKRTLVDYAKAAKKIAKESNVPFVAMNKVTCEFLAEIGEAASNQYFIKVPPDLYARYPKGKLDNTHLNVVGAAKVAQFFVRELIKLEHPLTRYVYKDNL